MRVSASRYLSSLPSYQRMMLAAHSGSMRTSSSSVTTFPSESLYSRSAIPVSVSCQHGHDFRVWAEEVAGSRDRISAPMLVAFHDFPRLAEAGSKLVHERLTVLAVYFAGIYVEIRMLLQQLRLHPVPKRLRRELVRPDGMPQQVLGQLVHLGETAQQPAGRQGRKGRDTECLRFHLVTAVVHVRPPATRTAV